MRRIILSTACFLITSIQLAAGPVAGYNLNTYDSLVLNGARCTGMGGSVVALGTEADDMFYNCAAPATRSKYQTSRFEFDYSFSLMNIIADDNNDYRNAGGAIPGYRDDGLRYFSLGLSLLFNRVGFSITYSSARSELTANTNSTYYLEQSVATLNVSWAAITNRLYVGFGLVTPKVAFLDQDENKLADYDFKKGSPINYQIGAIYTFKKIPLRLGLNLLVNKNGTEAIETNTQPIDLPKKVLHPTTLRVGAAYRFELIRDKSPWLTRDKKGKLKTKKIFSLKPEYLLVSGAVKIASSVDNALDIISFSDQNTILRSGTSTLIEPSLGIELSLPTWLRFNAGYYYEASRLENARPRHHFTCNIEARVIRLLGMELAASFTMDISRDFFSGGLGVKIWKY